MEFFLCVVFFALKTLPTMKIEWSHWKGFQKNGKNSLINRQACFKLGGHVQGKQKLDWLATDTDDITTQSYSSFACSREKIRLVENGLETRGIDRGDVYDVI
jgi:hypothetical protein